MIKGTKRFYPFVVLLASTSLAHLCVEHTLSTSHHHVPHPTPPVYGFDTFTGLPGDWHFFKSGDFSLDGQLPDVPDNVELVKVCGVRVQE